MKMCCQILELEGHTLAVQEDISLDTRAVLSSKTSISAHSNRTTQDFKTVSQICQCRRIEIHFLASGSTATSGEFDRSCTGLLYVAIECLFDPLEMRDTQCEPVEWTRVGASLLFHGSKSASGAPHNKWVTVSAYLFLVAASSHRLHGMRKGQQQQRLGIMIGVPFNMRAIW